MASLAESGGGQRSSTTKLIHWCDAGCMYVSVETEQLQDVKQLLLWTFWIKPRTIASAKASAGT